MEEGFRERFRSHKFKGKREKKASTKVCQWHFYKKIFCKTMWIEIELPKCISHPNGGVSALRLSIPPLEISSCTENFQFPYFDFLPKMKGKRGNMWDMNSMDRKPMGSDKRIESIQATPDFLQNLKILKYKFTLLFSELAERFKSMTTNIVFFKKICRNTTISYNP